MKTLSLEKEIAAIKLRLEKNRELIDTHRAYINKKMPAGKIVAVGVGLSFLYSFIYSVRKKNLRTALLGLSRKLFTLTKYVAFFQQAKDVKRKLEK